MNKDMTTVGYEIERQYDPAEARPAGVQAMIGVAGVAAVAPAEEQILGTVCYEPKDPR